MSYAEMRNIIDLLENIENSNNADKEKIKRALKELLNYVQNLSPRSSNLNELDMKKALGALALSGAIGLGGYAGLSPSNTPTSPTQMAASVQVDQEELKILQATAACSGILWAASNVGSDGDMEERMREASIEAYDMIAHHIEKGSKLGKMLEQTRQEAATKFSSWMKKAQSGDEESQKEIAGSILGCIMIMGMQ